MSVPIYVIGYARVSTPKQAQTGESLDDQEKYIRMHCVRNGWKLLNDKVYKEPFSGKTTMRPVYQEILAILAKDKRKTNIKYFVFWDFDRLTRGGMDDYNQMWRDLFPFGVEPRDTTSVIQPEINKLKEMGMDFEYPWAIGRPSEGAETAKVKSSEEEGRKILMRLIPAEIRNTQQGYHIGRCDDGYQSKKVFVAGKKKCVLEQNKVRADFIYEMFTLCSDRLYTDEEVCKIINAKGFRTPKLIKWNKEKTKQIGTSGSLRLNPKQLRRYIERPAYAGFVWEKWTHYKLVPMQYETTPQKIVPIDLYNKANRGKRFIKQLDNGSYELHHNFSSWSGKRRKYNPDFPYRGVFACDICKKPMTASKSKGKSGKLFGSYHCTRGHSRVAYPQSDVEKAFTDLLNRLAFTNDFLTILERTLVFEYRKKEAESATITATMNSKVADLERHKADTLNAFIVATNASVQKALEQKIEDTDKEIASIKLERNKSELKEEDLTDFIRWAKSLMEHPAKMLENIHSINELRGVLGLIFAEFPTFTELTNGTPKLSLVFMLNQQMSADNNQLVNSLGFDWNTLEAEVLRWKSVRANYPRVFVLSQIQPESLEIAGV